MRRRNSGGVLVIALAVLTGLVTLVAAFAASQRAAFRGLQVEVDKAQARRLALSGIERALAELSLADSNAVTLNDEWALLGEAGGQVFTVGSGTIRLEILDEGSFVNLNSATQDQLLNLGLTTEQVDSLLDWREAGQEPRPEGGKDEYYNNLPTPYNAALRPLRSFDELLLVKGFTPRDLYELPEERNTNQTVVSGNAEETPVLSNLATVWSRAPWTGQGGQARLNVNTAQAQQLIQRGLTPQLAQAIIQRRNTQGTFTSLGQVLTVPGVTLQNAPSILNNLSVDNSQTVTGRFNLNTVTEPVLNSMPELTPDIASAIVQRQSTGYTALGDLASVPGVSIQVLQQIADRFVVGSNAFRIRVIGISGTTQVPLEAVVRLDGTTPVIEGIFEQPFADMATRWIWDIQPTSEIVLAEDQ